MNEILSDEDFKEKVAELGKDLTVMQRNFANNLAAGMTQRQAYLKAGGKAKRENTQDSNASVMLRNPKVKAYYDLMNLKAMQDAIISKTEAMRILSDTAKAKMADFASYKFVEKFDDETGEKSMSVDYTTTPFEQLPAHMHHAIKSITMTKWGPKIELKDSNAAIKQLSKMGGWDSPTEITTPLDRPMNVKSETNVTSEEVCNALNNLMDKL